MTAIWESLWIASEAYEPDDAVGLAGLFIIGLPASISAVLAGLALWRQRGTPMRADLEEMRNEMLAGFIQVGRDIGGLREEIRTERTERIEGDKRR